jgi:hypothetical protein
MFKDELIRKYHSVGSPTDIASKSAKLNMNPRLFVILNLHNLMNDYMNLKVKPSKKDLLSVEFANAVDIIIDVIIEDVNHFRMCLYIPMSAKISEKAIKFVCDVTGLNYRVDTDENDYIISGWAY